MTSGFEADRLPVQFGDQLTLAQLLQSQAELSIAQANQKCNQELVAQNFISLRSLDEALPIFRWRRPNSRWPEQLQRV